MKKVICRKSFRVYHDHYIVYEKAIDNCVETFGFFIEKTHYQSRKNAMGTIQPINETQCQQSENETVINDCLVLIIKADAGATLIDKVKSCRHLNPEDEGDLFLHTMKMWNGTKKAFDNSRISMEFSRQPSVNSFIKEFDYYALKFLLPYNYQGAKEFDDSYDRSKFFKQICEDQVKLEAISSRLSFDDNFRNEAYKVN